MPEDRGAAWLLRLQPYLFIAPALLILLFIIVYPVVDVFRLALSHTDRAGNVTGFAGVANFERMLADPVFWRVVLQTVWWTTSILVVTTVISMVAALLLDREFTGRVFFRVAILLPWTVSAAVMAITWRYIYSQEYGLLNHTLKALGLIQQNIPWLGLPTLALAAVVWVGVINSVPFTTLGFLAGLQSVPDDLYEAADIDGASSWAKFWNVTMPSMKHVFAVVTLVNVILIFRNFPIIWVLTQGGPVNYTDVIGTYIYKTAFRSLDWGTASAISVFGFIVLMVFVVAYNFAVLRERVR